MRIGAGRFRNALLPAVGDHVRPVGGRLRQSLFTVLLPRLEGARVLDCCAGVGGLGLEALSRGAAEVVLVERDRRTADALARWIAERHVEREAHVVVADARRGGFGDGFDLVFLDPPFAAWDDAALARDLVAVAVAATAPDGVVAAKVPTRAPLPEDPRWRVTDRRGHGDAAWALIVRA